ncbi:AAA family ATPase [Zhongshania sp.]|jgi:SpoVK/Ycf46/Vps4 family AAA+-type ATPase|uniref:AAA family ATPase n=1 Tax=Zhongshania sp. TaxID=1971902 RepID=UPI002A81CD9C|nr:AAA family ATPase [Zhongshania sp.]
MARSDLVVNLVETGINGNLPLFVKTVEAIAEEARGRHHYHFADRLASLLNETKQESNRTQSNISDLQNAFYEVYTDKTLADIVLPETVLKACTELIEEHHRRELLRSYNLEPRHRILLSGPPGNGKTTLAEALANQMMLPLYIVKYEGIISRYLGETSVQLDKLFEHVKTRRCILFFDEFDAISKERGDENDNGEIKRIVNSLLKQIDNLPSHVIVIGATNHERMLDKAMWRRFQVQLTLPQPTRAMAIRWFESFAERIGHSLGYAPSTLADKLKGFSFAEFQEFGLDVQRQYVLGLPSSENKLKSIVKERLEFWVGRIRADQ